jgi:hypothetical protein
MRALGARVERKAVPRSPAIGADVARRIRFVRPSKQFAAKLASWRVFISRLQEPHSARAKVAAALPIVGDQDSSGVVATAIVNA